MDGDGDVSRGRVSFEDGGTSARRMEMRAQEELDVEDYFSEGRNGSVVSSSPSRNAGLSIKIPPSQIKVNIAFTALQYLPMPVLVLSSAKTVVLANEAMGRLFGIDVEAEPEPELNGDEESRALHSLDSKEIRTATDVLYGQTLAQLGIDLLQNGSAVFMAWEDFLETIVDDASKAQCSTTQLNTFHARKDHDATPTMSGVATKRPGSAASSTHRSQSGRSKAEVHDAVVDVVFSTDRDSRTGLPRASRHDTSCHVQANLIISVWADEDEQYFTLTFTAARNEVAQTSVPKTTTRTVARSATGITNSTLGSGLSSGSSSNESSQRRSADRGTPTTSSSNLASPLGQPRVSFPPMGPPTKSTSASAPTMFSKTNRMKDAILNSMSIPAYALWKGEYRLCKME
jgi:hypothetical protein